MTDYVWYPVTGDGQSQATEFVWTGTVALNWNTSADWVQGSTLVFQNPALAPGAVPGSGGGSGAGASQGAGKDNVGLVAGDVTSLALEYYTPNPPKGDPYIGSNDFPVDVLINSGTVDINNLLLAGFNQYAFGDPAQLPTLDVEGATFKVEGSIANSAVVSFPTITNVPFIGTAGGVLPATGGGTIDIGTGGTVQLAGSVQSQIMLDFKDASGDLLTLAGVSAAAPGAFAGTIENFAAGDTIFLPGLTAAGSETAAFSSGTLTISNGTTTLATLPMAGTYTSSNFALSSANGGTDVTIQTSGPGTVTGTTIANAYQGILRTPITGGATGSIATSEAAAIDGGQQTLAGYENSLVSLEQTLYSTLPALVSIDAMYNATPSSALLDTTAASTEGPSQLGYYSATYLHNLGYSDANVWTIMASQWGADPNSAFYKEYNSYGTDYGDFISSVYQHEFGFAPSSTSLQTLVNDVPGVQALLSGPNSSPTPIQVVSGIYGYLLYVGQTTPSLPTLYATSADAFLVAAANGTAVYGPELTQEFPPASTASVTGSAMLAQDPNVISVSSADQLVDPGAGDHTIQFLAGSSNDTLVLHGGGVDQVSGFDPGSDVLDVRSLLAGTGLDLTGSASGLANYLTVVDQGGDAVLTFDPSGHGGGSTVAVLQGLGNSVTSLATLIADKAVRFG